MNPAQLSNKLRRLASAIESDPNPSKAKVAKAINKVVGGLRTASPVQITKFVYDEGDGRSAGRLQYAAQTHIGLIELDIEVSPSGDHQYDSVRLNGEPQQRNGRLGYEKIEIADELLHDIPHDYSGDRAVADYKANGREILAREIEEAVGPA